MNGTHYLVCKLHRWDDIEVKLANGQTQKLFQPPNCGIVGFIPVYNDHKKAITESGGQDIIALKISNENGEFIKEGDPDANTEDS